MVGWQIVAALFWPWEARHYFYLKAGCEGGELSETATCKEYLQVRRKGKRLVTRGILQYNLPAILVADMENDVNPKGRTD